MGRERVPERGPVAHVADGDVDWRTSKAEFEARAYWALPHGGPDPLGNRPIPIWYYAWLD